MTSARAECNLETGENLETVAIQKQGNSSNKPCPSLGEEHRDNAHKALWLTTHQAPSKATAPLFLLEFTGCLESGGGGAFLSELLPP